MLRMENIEEDDEKNDNVAEDEVEDDDVGEAEVEDDDVEDDDVKGEEDDVDDEEENNVKEDDNEEKKILRPGPTLCASLRSRNALAHVTRAIFVREFTGKMPRNSWIPRLRPTLCASLCGRIALAHVARAILCKNLRVKCRGPAGSQDRDPHFVRACAIEMHLHVSQETCCARIDR